MEDTRLAWRPSSPQGTGAGCTSTTPAPTLLPWGSCTLPVDASRSPHSFRAVWVVRAGPGEGVEIVRPYSPAVHQLGMDAAEGVETGAARLKEMSATTPIRPAFQTGRRRRPTILAAETTWWWHGTYATDARTHNKAGRRGTRCNRATHPLPSLAWCPGEFDGGTYRAPEDPSGPMIWPWPTEFQVGRWRQSDALSTSGW